MGKGNRGRNGAYLQPVAYPFRQEADGISRGRAGSESHDLAVLDEANAGLGRRFLFRLIVVHGASIIPRPGAFALRLEKVFRFRAADGWQTLAGRVASGRGFVFPAAAPG